MPPSPSVGGSVADLFATLGIDVGPLVEGLRDVEVRMKDSAAKQAVSIKSISDLYHHLPEVFIEVTSAYRKMGKTLQDVDNDILAALQLVQEEKRRVAQEEAVLRAQKIEADKAYVATYKRLLRERDDADRAQIQAAQMRQREEATVNAAHASALQMRSRETAAAYAAAAELEFTREQEREALLWGEGGGMLGSLTKRIAFYAAIGLAIRGVTTTLTDAIAIERESAQTGFGVQGIQELRYAATQSLVPIEAVTTAIARMQQKIEGADGGAVQSFQVLGLNLKEVAKVAEGDPLQAFNQVADAISHLKDQGQAASVIGDLFGKGSSSAQMREFFTEYANLRKKAHEEGVILSAQEIANIASLGKAWETAKAKMEAYFGSAVSRAVEASSSNNVAGRVIGGAIGFGLGATAGAIAGAPTGIGALPGAAIGAFGLGAAGEIKGAETEAGIKALFGSGSVPNPGVLPPRGQGASGPSLRTFGNNRQGNAEFSIAESTSALLTKTANQKIAEELRAERAAAAEKKRAEAKALRDAKEAYSISLMIAALNELGVSGTHNAEKMGRAMEEVWRSFRRGRVSLQELTEATSNYFNMLEENAARPALKEAIRMFEQGLIGPDELLKARDRANAMSARGGAEDAFARGDIGPDQLMDAQHRFRDTLRESMPREGTDMLMGPGGSYMGAPRLRQLPSQPSDQGSGNINIVPMDQFSEQMIRRWKQQGLLTR